MSPISFGRGGRDNGTPATYFNNGVRKFDRMVSLASYKGPSFSTSLSPKKDCVNMLSEAVFTWPCVHSAWSAQMPHSRPGKGPPCLRIRLCFSSTQQLLCIWDLNTNFLSEVKNIEMSHISISLVLEASQRINLPIRTFCDRATILLVTESMISYKRTTSEFFKLFF